MNNIVNYKKKNVGILGLGLSGLAAAKVLLKSEANIFVFDDKKEKPSIIEKRNWINYNYWWFVCFRNHIRHCTNSFFQAYR